MKTGVVFQINESHALILEQGGSFKRVRPKKSWAVGDVVPANAVHSSRSLRFWTGQVAGILLILFTIQFGINHYYSQPVTYISLDVNPSIEIAVNRLDRVISVSSFNEDGTRVLERTRLVGKKYSDAVQTLIETDGMQPYLASDPYVVVAVSSDADRENELAYNLYKLIGSMGISQDAFQYLCSVEEWNQVEKAHDLGTTVGRLSLFEQLEEKESGLTLDEFLTRSMSDILTQLKGGA